jgi:hypothetical protein
MRLFFFGLAGLAAAGLTAVGGAPGRRFYLVMSLVLAAIVAFGFSHTVPFDLQPPGLPPMLQLHAAVFVAWVLLFVAQPVLVANRAVATHRKLGWAGTGLAAAMLLMGGYAILFALRADSVPPFYSHGLFLVRGILGLTVFAGLITAAIVMRRRLEWHRRLMLCASIAVIVPGLERALPFPALGPHWYFAADAVVDLIALIGPAMDVIKRHRVHPAYYWGVGALVTGQVITDMLANAGVVATALNALGARS